MDRIAPRPPEVRFRVDPAYVGSEKVARRMGLTADQFASCRFKLLARGFPAPDETTGLYDLEAVDRWRKRQRPDLYPELTVAPLAVETAPPRKSMGERFVEAAQRGRNG